MGLFRNIAYDQYLDVIVVVLRVLIVKTFVV